jgi:hypothetical protein
MKDVVTALRTFMDERDKQIWRIEQRKKEAAQDVKTKKMCCATDDEAKRM